MRRPIRAGDETIAARADDILAALARGDHDARLLVVMAHPDDEVLWIGSVIAHRDVTLVHLTDGAPRDPWFWERAGCRDAREYAALRASELDAALAVLGLAGAPRVTLGARDQEAALDLAGLSRRVSRILADVRPRAVIAHAYDGGHPDHDAAAFVARAAIVLAASPPPVLLDAAGYHAGSGRLELGFLPRPENARARDLVLSPEQRARKRRALACFASQREVLARLDASTERLRPGAREDFAAAPHPGRLHYEEHGWAIDGRVFRGHARAAARALGIPEALG